MGSCSEHLKNHVPGKGHELNRSASPMPESKAAKDVPNLPNGAARSRGSRTEGGRANIAPSMDGGSNLSK